MSSGEKFFKRSKTDFQEIKINRMTLVDITAAWLYATRMVDEANNISNIQFSDLFGDSTEEYVTLKVFTRGKQD